jgi:transposase
LLHHNNVGSLDPSRLWFVEDHWLGRKEPNVIIIGVDYHPSDQYIAFVDTETGEGDERRLNHSDGEAEKFYRELAARGASVRVGMETTGYTRWFERLLAELGMELWIGDAAKIKTKRVRKQKTDRNDAQLLLQLLVDNKFPQIWVPSPENRDLRQLLWHRHRLVQMRTRIMNQLQALAMNEGQRRKKKLWSEAGRAQLEKLALAPWASRRRQDLLELLDRMNPSIEGLTAAIEQEAKKWPEVLRLMTHPGVGPITALAFVLIIGTVERFQCGKQIGSYVGLIPCEDSSAGHQRLGHITKQGSSLLRFLLGEAAQAAARCDADWRRRYMHLAMRRQRNIAKVAMARRLGVRLYWMWRKGWEYSDWIKFGSHAGQLGTGNGVQ